ASVIVLLRADLDLRAVVPGHVNEAVNIFNRKLAPRARHVEGALLALLILVRPISEITRLRCEHGYACHRNEYRSLHFDTSLPPSFCSASEACCLTVSSVPG